MTGNNDILDEPQHNDVNLTRGDDECQSEYAEHNWHGIYGDGGQYLFDYCDRCRIEVNP